MKLDDNEIAFFGAIMFAAGANKTAGQSVEALAMMNPEQFREAREVAERELPQFKRRMKERRKRVPVS